MSTPVKGDRIARARGSAANNRAISRRSAATRNLLEEYSHLLQSYVEGKQKTTLRRAYALGRQVANGGGILKLAAIHRRVVRDLLRRPEPLQERAAEAAKTHDLLCAACPAWYSNPDEREREGKALEAFFTNSLPAFVKQHRGLEKTNSALCRLNEMREQEARRIAQALHDEAAQLLAAVHLALDDVARDLEIPQRERISGVRVMLDQIEEELRRLSHELCPTILQDRGLLPALKVLAEGVSRRTGLRISVDSPANGRFPILIETAIYRMVQEALNNTAKHAHATQATIEVRKNAGEVSCSVRDNGAGFRATDVLGRRGGRGLGLMGIRERLEALAGTLSITTSPGRGTELVARLPLRCC